MKHKISRGFTLLEVMIAVLVLSLGLLGMAALQAYSMRNNQSANYRTHATNLAYQLLDMARSHRGMTVDASGNPMAANYNVQALLSATSGNFTAVRSSIDGLPASCMATTRNPVTCDRERWLNAVRATLPQGRARTNFNAGTGELTIEICWRDDRAAADAESSTSSNCTLASEGYGQKTIGPDGSDWDNNAYWMRTRI
ncbi:MAG: type IV pilus modification protein PilV [Lysobacteraceae bacterium]